MLLELADALVVTHIVVDVEVEVDWEEQLFVTFAVSFVARDENLLRFLLAMANVVAVRRIGDRWTNERQKKIVLREEEKMVYNVKRGL